MRPTRSTLVTRAAAADLPSQPIPAQLPWNDSSLQVVLDRRGRVSAFVHVGESTAERRAAREAGGNAARAPVEALE